MSMNVTGLSLDEVTRLLRLAKRDVETLQAAVRKANAYAKRLEAELEAASPECPSCLQLRRDRGGDHRAPVALQDGGVAYLRRDGSTVTTQGPPLVFEATEPTPPPHVPGFTVTPTGDVAFHTGRPRYRVVCDACGEEVHEGTTGPEVMAAYHTCERPAPTRRSLT